MDQQQIKALGDELYNSLVNRITVKPLTERFPDIKVEDSYEISKVMTENRVGRGDKSVRVVHKAA